MMPQDGRRGTGSRSDTNICPPGWSSSAWRASRNRRTSSPRISSESASIRPARRKKGLPHEGSPTIPREIFPNQVWQRNHCVRLSSPCHPQRSFGYACGLSPKSTAHPRKSGAPHFISGFKTALAPAAGTARAADYPAAARRTVHRLTARRLPCGRYRRPRPASPRNR